ALRPGYPRRGLARRSDPACGTPAARGTACSWCCRGVVPGEVIGGDGLRLRDRIRRRLKRRERLIYGFDASRLRPLNEGEPDCCDGDDDESDEDPMISANTRARGSAARSRLLDSAVAHVA